MVEFDQESAPGRSETLDVIRAPSFATVPRTGGRMAFSRGAPAPALAVASAIGALRIFQGAQIPQYQAAGACSLPGVQFTTTVAGCTTACVGVLLQ